MFITCYIRFSNENINQFTQAMKIQTVPSKKSLGEEIKILMVQKDVSGVALSTATGYSKTTITAIRNGNASYNAILKVRDYLLTL